MRWRSILVSAISLAMSVMETSAYSTSADKVGTVDSLINKCNEEISLSRYDSVAFYAEMLMEEGVSLKDERAEGYSYLYSALSSLLSHNNAVDIEKYLDNALVTGGNIHDDLLVCQVYNAYGIYMVDKEMNYLRGIEYFMESMDMAKRAGSRYRYLVAQSNLASAYYMRNDTTAFKYALETYREAGRTGNEYLAFSAAIICAYIHSSVGAYGKALPYIEEVVPKADTYGHKSEIYCIYADIMLSRGEMQEADRYYELAVTNIDSTNAAAGESVSEAVEVSGRLWADGFLEEHRTVPLRSSRHFGGNNVV